MLQGLNFMNMASQLLLFQVTSSLEFYVAEIDTLTWESRMHSITAFLHYDTAYAITSDCLQVCKDHSYLHNLHHFRNR